MYYAKIDSNNIVQQVIVADSDYVATLSGTWIQTDINGVSPVNYAGIGYTWNATANAFISPQPYPSWTLATPSYKWEAPIPYPTDGNKYSWDESTTSWVAIS